MEKTNEMKTYTASVDDGWNDETTIKATSMEDAWNQAIEWAKEGDWYSPHLDPPDVIDDVEWYGKREVEPCLTVSNDDDEEEEERSETISIPVPADDYCAIVSEKMDERIIDDEDDPPVSCGSADSDHNWKENAVYSVGASIHNYYTCRNCGMRSHEFSAHEQDRVAGQGGDGQWYAVPVDEWKPEEDE